MTKWSLCTTEPEFTQQAPPLLGLVSGHPDPLLQKVLLFTLSCPELVSEALNHYVSTDTCPSAEPHAQPDIKKSCTLLW